MSKCRGAILGISVPVLDTLTSVVLMTGTPIQSLYQVPTTVEAGFVSLGIPRLQAHERPEEHLLLLLIQLHVRSNYLVWYRYAIIGPHCSCVNYLRQDL